MFKLFVVSHMTSYGTHHSISIAQTVIPFETKEQADIAYYNILDTSKQQPDKNLKTLVTKLY